MPPLLKQTAARSETILFWEKETSITYHFELMDPLHAGGYYITSNCMLLVLCCEALYGCDCFSIEEVVCNCFVLLF